MKKKLTIVSVALIVVLAVSMLFVLTACGGDGEKEVVKVINIQLTEEEYAFGVDKAQPELLQSVNEILVAIKSDGTFQKILDKYFNGEEITPIASATKDVNKADKQLVVATNADFAPFEYAMGDKYAGIDIEIVAIIAERLGMELVIDDMKFEAVVTSVGINAVDMAAAGLTVNETRKEAVNFSESYYNASQVLIVKAGDTRFDNCKTVADVEAILADGSYKVGVQNGTTGQSYIEGNEDWDFPGFSNIECKGYDNGGMAVRDMLNGNIDFVCIDEAPAKAIAKGYNGK